MAAPNITQLAMRETRLTAHDWAISRPVRGCEAAASPLYSALTMNTLSGSGA